MKSRFLERSLAAVLLFIAIGMTIHTPLTLWLGTLFPPYELLLKAWKEILMGVGFVLLIVAAAQKKAIDTLLNDRIMQLCLVFAGIHFVMMAVFQNGLDTAGAGLLIDLRYILYFVLVYGFVTLFPSYRRLFITAFAIGAVVILSFAVLQVFVLPKDILSHIGYSLSTISPYLTVDENHDYIRINSFLRGPNPLGAYAVICLALVLATVGKWKLGRQGKIVAGLIAVAALVALWASYSRSSAIAAVAVIAVVGLIVVTPKIRKLLALGAIGVVIVASGLVVVFRDTPFVANVILHNDPTTGADVDSNAGHAESLADGTSRMIAQPFGAGIGSTGSASLLGDKPLIIENQYLLVAHEVGWVGLAIFTWLFYEIMKRLWQRRDSSLALGMFGSGIGLAIIGLLLPVWTDDTVSIVWWGLAAVAIAAPLRPKKGN